MGSLPVGLNTRLGKRPTKPASGYNMYYQAQSKRVRQRDTALRLYRDRVILPGSSSDPMAIAAAIGENVDLSPTKKVNATQLIGGKWKNLSKEGKDLYAIMSKAELERYHANKQCWIVLDRILHPDGHEGTTPTTTPNAKGSAATRPQPVQAGQPDNGAFTHGIHVGNEKYRHLMIFLI